MVRANPISSRALDDLLAETRRRGRRRVRRRRALAGAVGLVVAVAVAVPAFLVAAPNHGSQIRTIGASGQHAVPTTAPGSTSSVLAREGLLVPDTYQQACANESTACLPGTTGPIPAALKRPLHFPVLRPGQSCPATFGHLANTSYFVGSALGNGSVRVLISNTGDLLHGIAQVGTTQVKGWYALQTLWFSVPGYDGPFVVRAKRLDGPDRISIGGSPAAVGPIVVAPGPTMNTSAGYRTVPGSTWVTAPGCYAWQVDGLNFSDVIVIKMTPPTKQPG